MYRLVNCSTPTILFPIYAEKFLCEYTAVGPCSLMIRLVATAGVHQQDTLKLLYLFLFLSQPSVELWCVCQCSLSV